MLLGQFISQIPPYGLPDGFNDARREIDFCGVFRIQPNGNVDLLCKTMTRPNGIAFSPDQKKLYVAQSDPDAPILKVFNVSENGMLDAGKTFFDATTLSVTRKGNPDGLAVDTKGNLFATGPGGVLGHSSRRNSPRNNSHRTENSKLLLWRRRPLIIHDSRYASLPHPTDNQWLVSQSSSL